MIGARGRRVKSGNRVRPRQKGCCPSRPNPARSGPRIEDSSCRPRQPAWFDHHLFRRGSVTAAQPPLVHQHAEDLGLEDAGQGLRVQADAGQASAGSGPDRVRNQGLEMRMPLAPVAGALHGGHGCAPDVLFRKGRPIHFGQGRPRDRASRGQDRRSAHLVRGAPIGASDGCRTVSRNSPVRLVQFVCSRRSRPDALPIPTPTSNRNQRRGR
jgi:hypothetical protein